MKRTRRFSSIVAIAALALVAGPSNSRAEPETVLDLSFSPSTGGVVRPPLDRGVIVKILQLADGSMLLDVARSPYNDSVGFENDLVKLRFDGTLDPSFGATQPTPGVVRTPVGGAADMAVDSQGRILLGGTESLLRLTPNGEPDETFQPDCWPCHLPVGSVYTQGSIGNFVVLPDDSIVVASGSQWSNALVLSKFTSTGKLDVTFNASGPEPGVIKFDLLGEARVAALSDGRLILARAWASPASMYRFTANGEADPSTGGSNGLVPLDFLDSNDEIFDLHVLPDDQMMFATGEFFTGVHDSYFLTDVDGRLDSTFADHGRLDTTLFDGIPSGPIAFLSDGRFMVSVLQGDGTTAIARFTADGHLDGSFRATSASPGWLLLDPPAVPYYTHDVATLTIGAHDRVIVGGALGRSFYRAYWEIDPELYRFVEVPQPPVPIPLYSYADRPLPPPVSPPSSPTDPDFQALTPARLLDTRSGMSTIDGTFAGTGQRPSGSALSLPVVGRGGVPVDAVAVALTVTVTGATLPGYVTVFSCDATPPVASNVNFTPGESISNAVVTKVGADGHVCLFTSAATDMVVDVTGAFPAGTAVVTQTPARLLETRPGLPTIDGLQRGVGAVAPGSSTAIQVVDRAGVPSTAGAAILNLTVTEPLADGMAALYPCDRGRPLASTLNFAGGQTVANLAVTDLAADGSVCLFSTVTAHFVVDVAGYFPRSSSFTGLQPARLLDTRVGESTVDHQYQGGGARRAGKVTLLHVAGRGGAPNHARSVVLNVTATEEKADGYVTVYPCDAPRPLASAVNFSAGATVAGTTFVRLDTAGDVCIFNNQATQLVVDVQGVFR